jgi:hypothetical protein
MYIPDDPSDGLPPPKSQYHKMLYDIGDALVEAFGGDITEIPSGKVAGVSPADQKFLNALRRIKQAVQTAQSGGGGGGIPDVQNDNKKYGRKNKAWDEIIEFSGDYDDLSDKPAIGGIPLDKTSTAAGLGLYTKPSTGIPATDMDTAVQTSLGKADSALQSETDPTVPTWAKAETKPTYTASEVGLGSVDNTSDADKPISTAAQAALDKKANIYIRLQQGTTIGNNVQGMHIIPVAPATYTADWSLTSADGASFVRTDNNLIYTKADSTTVTIIENGTILIDDYRIDDVFNVAANDRGFCGGAAFLPFF